MKSKSSSLQLAHQHEICLERLLPSVSSSDDLYPSSSNSRLIPRTPPKSPSPFCSGENSPFLRRSSFHSEGIRKIPKLPAISAVRRGIYSSPTRQKWYRVVTIITFLLFIFAVALSIDVMYTDPRRDIESCTPVRSPDKGEWRQALHLYERHRASNKKNKQNISSFTTQNSLRQSDLIFWGSHNSYHRAPASSSFPFLGALVPSWDYSHSALRKQLESGARHLELDVHIDAELRLATVYHVPSLDSRTRCYCLQSCAQVLLDWSKSRNGQHSLVFILLEPKGARSLFEDFRARSRGFGTDSTQTRKVLKVLDDALLQTFNQNPQALLTPYDLLTDEHHTLVESISSRGWPEHDALVGKFAFALLDSTPNLALARAYLRDGIRHDAPIFTMATHLDQLLPGYRLLINSHHRSLTLSLQNASKYWRQHKNRYPITNSESEQNQVAQLPPPRLDAVILKLDNPKRADFFEDCRTAVQKGFLVRTRANTMRRPNDDLRFSLAIKSGAQLVSFEADAASHWQIFLNHASSQKHDICSCDNIALENSKRKCNIHKPPCL
uniref:Phosphatidylinositol-specific phospholipase C X domain-containing protein n=1 Tax=Aureoumbra lagunensis TaxID=44058 RepID=A0A7S3NDG4_9STRA|mmetsp:Transcript_6878/g.10224  ORF Transcript_6878/g.10224 Transcript_6878/m.10224 type:complete len:553 (-) Transcript_6878:36-1694(-)